MANNMDLNGNNGSVEITAVFFKESGKYYAEEKIAIPDKTMQVFQIVDWLRNNVKNYKGMSLVAMLGELDHGYPVMIPGSERN